MSDDTEPLLINGAAVDRGLLDARPIRRCRVEECQSHCCGGGVYISVEQVDDILAHADLIQPHLPEERRDPAQWFDGLVVPDDDHPAGGQTMSTNVLDDPTHPSGTCCVFLRPDRKCALQAAGMATGEHPWRFKPFYCALHPLVFERKVLMLAEQSEMYLEGGTCSRPAPGEAIPLYELYEMEVKLALGEAGYAMLEAEGKKGNEGTPQPMEVTLVA
jgi:hypothetical protein